jgi:hypothetical protein
MVRHLRRRKMKGMQESIRRLATPLVALLVLIVGPPAAWGADPVTIEGEIEVAEYDEQSGEPISVYIWDSDWYSVLISNEGKGRELLDHIGDVARVTGTITELDADSEFQYLMKVSSYTIEEPAEPEEYPEDEPDFDQDEER